MNDSTFHFPGSKEILNDSLIQDSVNLVKVHDSISAISSTFFQQSTLEIVQVLNSTPAYTWFIYLLLFQSFVVALIWYFIPERILYAFSITIKSDVARLNEKERPAPGAIVTVFFLLNALINISFLIYYSLTRLFDFDFHNGSYWETVLYISILIGGLFLLKMAAIRMAGVVFNTIEMARKQVRIYFNSNIALGVFLLPLLFTLLIVPEIYVLYGILFIVSIVFLIRWIQVISLGISITHFNFFHLILYLCTLEIIPVVVLLKIFM